jgi:hypothetical protein
MNRHERRRARRKAHHDRFYRAYIRHLPRVPLDAPFEPGTVHHVVVFHDSWCAFYAGKACNCSSVIRRYVEPRRS